MKDRREEPLRRRIDETNEGPFVLLASEHASLRTELRQTIRIAASQDARPSVRTAVQALRSTAERHMEEEDVILYPIAERLFGPHGAVLVLRQDHAAIRAMLNRAGPIHRNPAGLLENVAARMEEHLGREERVLFPMMAALLAEREMDRLARRLRSGIRP